MYIAETSERRGQISQRQQNRETEHKTGFLELSPRIATKTKNQNYCAVVKKLLTRA